jgi:hypothetical protein
VKKQPQSVQNFRKVSQENPFNLREKLTASTQRFRKSRKKTL